MKDKFMGCMIAILMIALCSIAAVAQTADSPIHINSLSEINNLNHGDIVKIDKLYRVGLFGNQLIVTDEENQFYTKIQCEVSWNNQNYSEFNKFHDDQSSSNQDYYDVLYNLICEVSYSSSSEYVMPELKLTINAGSAITGGQLSVNEKRFLMPVDIDPAILTASGKDYIKDYTNRLFRFRGKISSLKSPCSIEDCIYDVYGVPITDNSISQGKNYLYVGIFDYRSGKYCIGVEKTLIKRIWTTQNISWDFSALPNIPEGGTVSVSMNPGDTKIYDGEKASLTATPNEGYKFVKWTLNGKEVSAEKEFTTDPVYCNIGYVAVFAKEDEAAEEYDITVTADHPELGSVSVSPSRVVAGASVTATATPTDGARFVGWYNGDEKVSDDIQYTFTVSEAVTLTAHFVKTCKVTFDQSAGGVITVKCGETTLTSGDAVDAGSMVTVTATPAPNYVLQSISVNNSAQTLSENSATFEISEDIAIAASFVETPSVKTSIEELLSGSLVNDALVRFDTPLTVVEVLGNNDVDAVVTDGKKLLFLFNQSGVIGEWKPAVGDVLKGVEGRIKCDEASAARDATYKGVQIYLTRIPELSTEPNKEAPVEDATFDGVLNDYRNNGNKMLRLKGVNIYFGIVNPKWLYLAVRPPSVDQEKNMPLVKLSQENQDIKNAGEIYGNANWSKSLDVTGFIHAVAGEPGFHIMSCKVSTGGSEETSYLITLSASPVEGGKVWVNDDRNAVQKRCGAGETVMIHAEAAEGYTSKGWQKGSEAYSTEPAAEYVVEGNATLTALFEKQQEEKPDEPKKEKYAVKLSNGGHGSMKVTLPDGSVVADGQMIEEGTVLTVVLTADEMYLPSQLLVNDTPVGKESDGTYRVTVVGATVIASSFVPDAPGVYHLKISSRSPEGYIGGKVYIDREGTTAVEAHSGENHTFFAEAADGFKFTRWIYEGGSSGTGTTSRFEWPGQGNLSLVAVFDHAIGTERTITVRANDASKGSAVIVGEPEGTQSVKTRAVVKLKAVAASVYDRFVEWTVNGEIRKDAEIDIDGEGDAECVAYFASDYPVNFRAEGNGALICRSDGNEIESGTVMADGANVDVRATADAHYHLASLSVNGQDVLSQYLASTGGFIISIRKPTEIKAVFAIDRHRLLIGRHLHGHLEVFRALSPIGSGSGDKVESEMYHDYGSKLYVFAVPDEGYQLKSVTIDGRSLDMGVGYGTITINGDMTLACDFEEKPSGLSMPGADGESGSCDEWFDLSGRRVTPDALRPGNVYILRRNGRVSKVVITHSR